MNGMKIFMGRRPKMMKRIRTILAKTMPGITRTAVVVFVVIMIATVFVACAQGTADSGSSESMPQATAASGSSESMPQTATASGSPQSIPQTTADSGSSQSVTQTTAVSDFAASAEPDLTEDLRFEVVSITGTGTVLAELTNVSAAYDVLSAPEFWVTDDDGKRIPFIQGVMFEDNLQKLTIGSGYSYAFMAEELDAKMKPGTYYIHTNVYTMAADGELTSETISTPFTYGEPLTEISHDDALRYGKEYVEALQSGDDLAQNTTDEMDSWRKWLGLWSSDSVACELDQDSVKQDENTGDYRFCVNIVIEDMIFSVTVRIVLDDTATYYVHPGYFSTFSEYYTEAEYLAEEYITALKSNSAEKLALVLAYDRSKNPDWESKLDEAQEQIAYYSRQCDIASLALWENVTYNDRLLRFSQTVVDQNGEVFVLNVVCDDGMISIAAPQE
jgi:hypothetical protein